MREKTGKTEILIHCEIKRFSHYFFLFVNIFYLGIKICWIRWNILLRRRNWVLWFIYFLISRIPFFSQSGAFGRNWFYELRLFLLVRKICAKLKSDKKTPWQIFSIDTFVTLGVAWSWKNCDLFVSEKLLFFL